MRGPHLGTQRCRASDRVSARFSLIREILRPGGPVSLAAPSRRLRKRAPLGKFGGIVHPIQTRCGPDIAVFVFLKAPKAEGPDILTSTDHLIRSVGFLDSWIGSVHPIRRAVFLDTETNTCRPMSRGGSLDTE